MNDGSSMKPVKSHEVRSVQPSNQTSPMREAWSRSIPKQDRLPDGLSEMPLVDIPLSGKIEVNGVLISFRGLSGNWSAVLTFTIDTQRPYTRYLEMGESKFTIRDCLEVRVDLFMMNKDSVTCRFKIDKK